jgi:hypothetical protein
VRLRDFLICDHLTVVQGGKPAYIGVFDCVRITGERKSWEPVRLMPAVVCAFIGVGKHDPRGLSFVFRLVDADGKPTGEWELAKIDVEPPEDGLETAGLGYLAIGPNVSVPDVGDYTWEVHVNGQRLGAIPFWVRHVPPAATA